MKPFAKFGLLVGVISLILIIPVSAATDGFCGPPVTLVAGALAGFLTGYLGSPPSRAAGAQSGALAGALAGGINLAGQTLGTLMGTAWNHWMSATSPIEDVPTASSPLVEVIGYYLGGLGAGICFGILGVMLAAVAGSLCGALGTPRAPAGALMPPAAASDQPQQA